MAREAVGALSRAERIDEEVCVMWRERSSSSVRAGDHIVLGIVTMSRG